MQPAATNNFRDLTYVAYNCNAAKGMQWFELFNMMRSNHLDGHLYAHINLDPYHPGLEKVPTNDQ